MARRQAGQNDVGNPEAAKVVEEIAKEVRKNTKNEKEFYEEFCERIDPRNPQAPIHSTRKR